MYFGGYVVILNASVTHFCEYKLEIIKQITQYSTQLGRKQWFWDYFISCLIKLHNFNNCGIIFYIIYSRWWDNNFGIANFAIVNIKGQTVFSEVFFLSQLLVGGWVLTLQLIFIHTINICLSFYWQVDEYDIVIN